ncbi:MAG: hypothetical protein LQ352_001675 [Teloschistes flavicans]|nr:MAG: hypothetical protein LQ352_001675 [Teloschistes flavicans]
MPRLCKGRSSAPANPSTTSPPSPSPSTAGPIAGGVIAGVVFVMVLTYLVWRFCIKKRREQFDQNNEWADMKAETEKHDDFTTQRDARASTHTVGSIASTVLTRASNIIQIAYIPGVTNRSIESSPDLLIPPVPPIPAVSPTMSTVSTPQPGQQDQHYFMPGDLRDSTYSGYTEDDRTSFARSSMAPSMMRNSVATTAYRDHAVINPVPAQKIIRGKATAVSLKSNEKTSPIDTPRSATPPMPSINPRHAPASPAAMNTRSPIVARVGTPKAVNVIRTPSNHNLKTSSPLNPSSVKSPGSLNGDGSQRPVEKAQRRVSIQAPSHPAAVEDASSSDEDSHSPQEQSLMGHGRKASGSKGGVSPMSWQSPFKSPSSAPDLRHGSPVISSPSSSSPESWNKERKQKHKRSGSLNQIIEEATRRASREPRHGGLGSVGSIANWRKDGQGPFSDDHAAKTP